MVASNSGGDDDEGGAAVVMMMVMRSIDNGGDDGLITVQKRWLSQRLWWLTNWSKRSFEKQNSKLSWISRMFQSQYKFDKIFFI